MFAGIAFLLAAVGIYGVVSYDVGGRVQELGIRMALGAQKADVLRLILGHAARLAALGIALGLGGALVLTRLMASMLFEIQPHDFVTYAAAAVGSGASGAGCQLHAGTARHGPRPDQGACATNRTS